MQNQKLSIMTAKSFRLGIRNGMTMKKFLEKYQCSEEEFLIKLKSLYSNDEKSIKNFLSQIEANEKRPDKKDVEEVVPEEEVKEEEKPVSELEQAQATEAALLEELSKLQELEDFTKAKSNMAKASLKKIEAELSKLEKKVAELSHQYEQAKSDADIVIGALSEIAEQKKVKEEELKTARDIINDLQTIGVEVLRDGSINAIEQDVALETNGWEELYRQLSEDDRVQDLSVRDLKTLCKVFIIKQSSEKPILFIFDSENMEEVFKSFSLDELRQ